jgi:hypothetical protein
MVSAIQPGNQPDQKIQKKQVVKNYPAKAKLLGIYQMLGIYLMMGSYLIIAVYLMC